MYKRQVEGYEKGFYVGPTIFDHVKPGMDIGEREIFGPVTLIKRVRDFEEGITLMNANPYANGSVIFTQSGYYARAFEIRTDGGLVGINVGIPVPSAYFPFSGNKDSDVYKRQAFEDAFEITEGVVILAKADVIDIEDELQRVIT